MHRHDFREQSGSPVRVCACGSTWLPEGRYDRAALDAIGDVLMPPGGPSWDEFKAAMRSAHVTGGHQAGQAAPDISSESAFAKQIVARLQPAALPPPATPADPFAGLTPMTPGAIAATGLNEFYRDLMAGGFSRDDARKLIAELIVANSRQDKKDDSD
jgi:hypothetical protein